MFSLLHVLTALVPAAHNPAQTAWPRQCTKLNMEAHKTLNMIGPLTHNARPRRRTEPAPPTTQPPGSAGAQIHLLAPATQLLVGAPGALPAGPSGAQNSLPPPPPAHSTLFRFAPPNFSMF
jgi:hypothetical protein